MLTKDAIVGVDLGGTRVRAGKVRNGHLDVKVAHGISGRESVDFVMGEIYEAIDQVVDGSVAGIGCGVPSVVDVERGVVYAVENIPSWKEVPLKDALETRYGVPARVNNDANSFAVGELHFGRGRGYRNLVGITLGTGLGSGVVINGHLYSGMNCGAGEIGSFPYRDGTLENYCSGEYLKRVSGVRGEVLYERACNGDAEAIAIFDSLGYAMGDALLYVLYAFDPQIIVLGGSVSRAYPLFEAEMRKRLSVFPHPHVLERLEIVRSEIEDVAVLGAAAIYLDAID